MTTMTAAEFDKLGEKQATLLTMVEFYGKITSLRVVGRMISITSVKSLAAKGLIDASFGGRGGWTATKK